MLRHKRPLTRSIEHQGSTCPRACRPSTVGQEAPSRTALFRSAHVGENGMNCSAVWGPATRWRGLWHLMFRPGCELAASDCALHPGFLHSSDCAGCPVCSTGWEHCKPPPLLQELALFSVSLVSLQNSGPGGLFPLKKNARYRVLSRDPWVYGHRGDYSGRQAVRRTELSLPPGKPPPCLRASSLPCRGVLACTHAQRGLEEGPAVRCVSAGTVVGKVTGSQESTGRRDAGSALESML